MHGGFRERTVSTRICFSLTYAGVGVWKSVSSLGRRTLVAQNVSYVDVRAIERVSRVVIGRLYVPSLGRNTIVALACERGALVLACERGATARPLSCERGLISCARKLNLEGRFIARVPHYRRAKRLLRRRSGSVARLPCHQRHSDHHRFRCVAPCGSTRIVRDRAKLCPYNWWKTMHSVARSLGCE